MSRAWVMIIERLTALQIRVRGLVERILVDTHGDPIVSSRMTVSPRFNTHKGSRARRKRQRLRSNGSIVYED
jgi:hypothetical protein